MKPEYQVKKRKEKETERGRKEETEGIKKEREFAKFAVNFFITENHV